MTNLYGWTHYKSESEVRSRVCAPITNGKETKCDFGAKNNVTSNVSGIITNIFWIFLFRCWTAQKCTLLHFLKTSTIPLHSKFSRNRNKESFPKLRRKECILQCKKFAREGRENFDDIFPSRKKNKKRTGSHITEELDQTEEQRE